MTLFKSALKLTGLSQVEAASFLGMSLQSVKYWSAGIRNCPDEQWAKLASLYSDIQNGRETTFEGSKKLASAMKLLEDINRQPRD